MSTTKLGGRIAAICAAAMVWGVSLAYAQTGPVSDPQKHTQTQPSPQGQTGPLDPGSGGATPASPQGETPPDMQATSPGAADAPKGK